MVTNDGSSTKPNTVANWPGAGRAGYEAASRRSRSVRARLDEANQPAQLVVLAPSPYFVSPSGCDDTTTGAAIF